MSGDEVVVLAASGVFALVAWFLWYARPLEVERLGAGTGGRSLLFVTPPFAGAILFAVLKSASSHDVRDDSGYLFFYLVLGAAWLAIGAWCLPFVGVSPRDDVVERGNPAAAYAVAGALLAIMLCFAGGNVGDGPGWWVVVFSAALSTGALFLLWVALDALSGISDVVTIDRDAAAGVRLAGFLVACGIVLGRASAGDWVSAGATVRDFAVTAWPTLLLLAAAAYLDRLARPTPARPAAAVVGQGALPALLYLSAAAIHVGRLGPPA